MKFRYKFLEIIIWICIIYTFCRVPAVQCGPNDYLPSNLLSGVVRRDDGMAHKRASSARWPIRPGCPAK